MNFLDLLERSVNFWFSAIPQKTPAATLVQHVKLVAHRGAHHAKQGLIENTLPAFLRAQELGYWGIELDIHATQDNTLIVNHDSTLKRLWHQNICIADTLFQDIRNTVPQVPTLEEVVTQFGQRLHLFIELKWPFFALDELIETLSPLTPEKDYHLICLNEALLPPLVSYFPKAALLLVAVHNNTKRFCELSVKEGYGGVLGHYLFMNPPLIQQLKTHHQLCGSGFVNSQNSLYRELSRGAPYLFTDRAERTKQCFDRLFRQVMLP